MFRLLTWQYGVNRKYLLGDLIWRLCITDVC
jgi:hypothetical protein